MMPFYHQQSGISHWASVPENICTIHWAG